LYVSLVTTSQVVLIKGFKLEEKSQYRYCALVL
jgi:hypothetical protein